MPKSNIDEFYGLLNKKHVDEKYDAAVYAVVKDFASQDGSESLRQAFVAFGFEGWEPKKWLDSFSKGFPDKMTNEEKARFMDMAIILCLMRGPNISKIKKGANEQINALLKNLPNMVDKAGGDVKAFTLTRVMLARPEATKRILDMLNSSDQLANMRGIDRAYIPPKAHAIVHYPAILNQAMSGSPNQALIYGACQFLLVAQSLTFTNKGKELQKSGKKIEATRVSNFLRDTDVEVGYPQIFSNGGWVGVTTQAHIFGVDNYADEASNALSDMINGKFYQDYSVGQVNIVVKDYFAHHGKTKPEMRTAGESGA